MSLVEQAQQLLRDELEIQGLSQAELARRMGITPTTANFLLHRTTNPGLVQFERAAKALGIELEMRVR